MEFHPIDILDRRALERAGRGFHFKRFSYMQDGVAAVFNIYIIFYLGPLYLRHSKNAQMKRVKVFPIIM